MTDLSRYPWLRNDPLALELVAKGWTLDEICSAVERRAIQDEACSKDRGG